MDFVRIGRIGTPWNFLLRHGNRRYFRIFIYPDFIPNIFGFAKLFADYSSGCPIFPALSSLDIRKFLIALSDER